MKLSLVIGIFALKILFSNPDFSILSAGECSSMSAGLHMEDLSKYLKGVCMIEFCRLQFHRYSAYIKLPVVSMISGEVVFEIISELDATNCG